MSSKGSLLSRMLDAMETDADSSKSLQNAISVHSVMVLVLCVGVLGGAAYQKRAVILNSIKLELVKLKMPTSERLENGSKWHIRAKPWKKYNDTV